ncbi:hypothetical protein YPPY48_2276, partial [Yersinia pestis PY-48]
MFSGCVEVAQSQR